jgi:putative DNA primase/helicase
MPANEYDRNDDDFDHDGGHSIKATGPVVSLNEFHEKKKQKQAGVEAKPGRADEAVIDASISKPVKAAREFMKSRYRVSGCPTLWRWGGVLFKWTGVHYVAVDKGEIHAECWEFLTRINGGSEKITIKNTNELVHAVTNLITLPMDDIKEGDWLDDGAPPWGKGERVIVCANGVLRLSDKKLFAHDPRLFTLNSLAAAYDPKAKCPRWDQFLLELWPTDEEEQYRHTVDEFSGLTLIGDLKYQKAEYKLGAGRGGKGTIDQVRMAVHGPSGWCGPSLDQFGEPFGLEDLIGKKVAIIADARLDKRSKRAVICARLLSTTAGDPQSVNRKHIDYWRGILPSLLSLNANEMLNFGDETGTLPKRWLILPFDKSWYQKEDLDLLPKLKAELSGILSRWIEGLERLEKRGRFLTLASGELIKDLENLGSTVKSFVEARCELGPEFTVRRETLYTVYKRWCVENGEERLSSSEFYNKLVAAFRGQINRARPRVGDGRERVYVGIRLAGGA